MADQDDALKEALAKAWVDDLKARLPPGHVIYPMRRSGKREEKHFTVLTVMEMEQVDPHGGLWLAEVRLVCVCDHAAGGPPEQTGDRAWKIHRRRLGEAMRVLEATEAPARCAETGVVLHGYVVERVREARAEKVFSDVVFVTAGVSREGDAVGDDEEEGDG